MKKFSRYALFACLAVLLSGCAVQHVPATLQPLAGTVTLQRVVTTALEVQLPTGYTRTLRAGSVWRLAGILPQGEVYRPVGDVFTVEGAHIHEAYLVVKSDTLVGFYLPAERAFSPVAKPIPLAFQ